LKPNSAHPFLPKQYGYLIHRSVILILLFKPLKPNDIYIYIYVVPQR